MEQDMHLMTLDMGAWCGATQDGPGIFRASSQWRDVTCPACTAKGMAELRALVWDMLATMGKSREALSFAVRAGRLGVTGPDGVPLAMACAPEGAVFGPYAAGIVGDEDDEDDGKGCDCYRGPRAHAHKSDEDGDCVTCGCGRHIAPHDHDDPAERADALRMRREMAREAGDDSVDIGSPEDGDYDDCEPTL